MVLAVDDDSFMRVLLQRAFVDAGMRIETFASAPELLASTALHSPAVVLLDVKMPGMSGLQLQALLGERGIELPVMFLTGASDIAMAVAAMRAGAVDFVEKPFNAADLVQRVRQAFALYAQSVIAREPRPHAEQTRRLATLTAREREVHDRMVVGHTSKAIASDLGGSFRTVEIHRSRVMAKMGAAHMAELVRMSLGGAVRP